MSPDKLAYMANQIGRFFVTQPGGQAVAGIEDHIVKFWDLRMRKTLLDHLEQVELDPPVREALEHLKQTQAA
ncbi:MAG: formate dehydrogenase [Rhodospirillales bacterium 20-64-7]|nr:MAG: formate dehydrogenase [Rhodospirillales bacterium 20-64-7]HQT76474.1 formate dehydrogenase subunit delta [Rhodopila sp.]